MSQAVLPCVVLIRAVVCLVSNAEDRQRRDGAG